VLWPVLARRYLPIALVISLALAPACTKRTELPTNLTLAYEVSPLPARVGPTTIILKVADASGKPVTGARITFEGNMSHPGMAPVFADARETEPGRYQCSMELSMAGDWYVVAHVTLPDSRKLDHQFEIKGVAAAPEW
jgi:hypothetical protein